MIPRQLTPKPLSSVSAPALALLLVLTVALSGCFKKDPEENFNLWSNNQAGWVQMGKFVADPNNEQALRVRALEVLTLNGHPSQVMSVVEKAADKEKLLVSLRDLLNKTLKNPNEKLARYAKQVLFEMIGGMPEAEKTKTRQLIADWAFGDMSHDDQAKMVAEKLGRRMRPEEIEACRGYLEEQVALVQPRVVCALGNFATKLLSGSPEGISQVHGQPQPVAFGGHKTLLYPVFHPAAALYTRSMLATLEEDFARLPGLSGGPSKPTARPAPEPAGHAGDSRQMDLF